MIPADVKLEYILASHSACFHLNVKSNSREPSLDETSDQMLEFRHCGGAYLETRNDWPRIARDRAAHSESALIDPG